MTADDQLLLRALALRKRQKIGCLWAEEGKYWISEHRFDPYGCRVRISLEALRVLVEQVEAEEAPRKPITSEGAIEPAITLLRSKTF